MLERFTLPATFHQFAHVRQLGLGKFALEIEIQLHAREFEGVRQEQFRLQTRRVHPLVRQEVRAFLNDFKHRHARSLGAFTQTASKSDKRWQQSQRSLATWFPRPRPQSEIESDPRFQPEACVCSLVRISNANREHTRNQS
jgi:hypothetical protein